MPLTQNRQSRRSYSPWWYQTKSERAVWTGGEINFGFGFKELTNFQKCFALATFVKPHSSSLTSYEEGNNELFPTRRVPK